MCLHVYTKVFYGAHGRSEDTLRVIPLLPSYSLCRLTQGKVALPAETSNRKSAFLVVSGHECC